MSDSLLFASGAFGGSDRIEDDAANSGWRIPHGSQREASPIRNTEQVPLLVAERATKIVEVLGAGDAVVESESIPCASIFSRQASTASTTNALRSAADKPLNVAVLSENDISGQNSGSEYPVPRWSKKIRSRSCR